MWVSPLTWFSCHNSGMTNTAGSSNTRVLTEAECWELTVNAFFARLGTYEKGDIFITPINILTHNGKVYFRTAPGSKLARLQAEDRVTLQFDRTTEEYAYSVNIHGNARALTDPVEIQQVALLGSASWIKSEKNEYVEITPRVMTGRYFNLKA